MSAIRIHECTLTIRRRHGWSWGAGAESHVAAALAGLEATLQAVVEEAGVDPSLDLRFEDPVELELVHDSAVSAASRRALIERLRAAATVAAAASAEAQDGATPAIVAEAESVLRDVARDSVAGGALARTLARWSRGGQLPRVVQRWPEPVLRAWIDAIERAARDTSAAPMHPDAVARIADAVAGAPRTGEPPRAALERLLAVLGALAATLGDALPDATTQALARERIAGGDPVRATAARDAEEPTGAAAIGDRAPARATADPASASARDALAASSAQPVPRPRTDVVPALGLLVLAQLSRIGYTDALAAAAAAADLDAGALAAALAAKALPPPALGWRREPAEEAALVVASGGAAELGAVGDAAAALVPPLSGALQAAYAEGRSAQDEVLVTATADGIVVGEPDAGLPIAWIATDAELEAVLESLGRPPARRTDAFAGFARALGERVALPQVDAPALERHLGAAAGTALGLLALDLWGAEQATPLLALERLGDLEARVRLDADGLTVAIPRGQRWLDLQRGGLLTRFVLPWLPGERLEFETW